MWHTGGKDRMKRIAIGIAHPPGSLAEIMIGRSKAGLKKGAVSGWDANNNRLFHRVCCRGELSDDLMMVYSDEGSYHGQDNGYHIIP
jgi:hypothetical protein